MSNYKPINLTDEEINELLQDTSNKSTPTSYSNYRGYYHSYNDWQDYSRPVRRRHEWTPVLLLKNTVYDCKHCGAKKEKTKDEYCEEEF